MILIVSTCKEKLSELEFVRPIALLIENHNIKHISEIKEPDLSADKIIICGTALKDFDYLNQDISWLNSFDKPILGICSGAQLIAKAFDVPIVDDLQIGVKNVSVIKENKLVSEDFSAYFLHSKSINGFDVLAESNSPCMFKHPEKEIYCINFHLEVLNKEIIENFIKI